METAEITIEVAAKKRPKKALFWHALTVFSFFALLVCLLVLKIASDDKPFSQTENRYLEQKPKLGISAVKSGDFMSRVENYFSDQFPFRDRIVSFKSAAERSLGKTEQNNVYIGKDGWLFENQSKYDAKKVKLTTDALSEFSENCKIKNQVFMLVPDSTFFMKDKLPRFLQFESQAEQIAQIHKALPENMKKIDSVKMFDSVKDKSTLYYKTDHHWTSRAAKTAFDFTAPQLGIDASKTEFEFHRLTDNFYGTLASSSGIYDSPDAIEVCIPKNSGGTYVVNNADEKSKAPSLFALSKLDLTNKYEVFLGGNFSRITISTTNLNHKNLLILKDSYANCFIPMLTPFYQNIVIIDARYFTDNINDILLDYKFTDLLVLYNVNTFLEDASLKDVL